jgi:ankyrin repeat protein
VVQLLLAAHAEVNAKDINGWTPLRWATTWGRLEVVKELLAAQVEVDAKDISGRRP